MIPGNSWRTTEEIKDDETINIINLTSEVDNLVGSDQQDQFNGVVSINSNRNTLNSSDSIDGKGEEDTLDITLETSFSGFTDGSVTNIENIVLTNDSSVERTFNATGIQGAESYTLNSEKAEIKEISNLNKSVDITINNQKDGKFTTKFAESALEINSQTDTMNLNLNDVGEKEAVEINLTDIENVNLSSDTLKVEEDSENSITLVGEDLKSLNIKGGSSLNLVESSENLTSVDATQLKAL